MGIGERWQRWVNRLTHGEPEKARAGGDRITGVDKGTRPAPESARPIGKVPTARNGELELSIEPGTRSIPQRRKGRSGGFDPYSNDAGYEKPRNWDEVDPR
jgi:hypothetical protein